MTQNTTTLLKLAENLWSSCEQFIAIPVDQWDIVNKKGSPNIRSRFAVSMFMLVPIAKELKNRGLPLPIELEAILDELEK